MLIQELKTSTIKRELKANKCKFRYHNKNKCGGNFGINIIFGEWLQEDYKNYEISGMYNVQGVLTHLSIGRAYQIGFKVEVENISDLIKELKEMIAKGDNY